MERRQGLIRSWAFLAITCMPAIGFASELFVVESKNLHVLDTQTGSSTLVGDLGVYLTDLAFSPDGDLYGISFSSLYSIDPLTGTSTVIGSLGITDANALEFDETGTLFLAGSGSTLLRTVDTATGSTEVVGDTGFVSSGDLAYGPDGKLYMSAASGSDGGSDALVVIEPSSADASSIGAINYTQVFGLTFMGDTLLGMTFSGDLLVVDTFTGLGTSLLSTGLQVAGSALDPQSGPNLLPISTAPEPAAITLLGLGILGSLAVRRKRRSASP